MKLILFFVVSCLAFHNGEGAPTAVYKFVKCNPEGDQANCVAQQTPKMAWSPDLPARLPASTAQYLEAEPEEDEHSPREEEMELKMEGEDMTREEGESLGKTEDGSGGHEGSADTYMADWALGETGSGESWAEKDGEQYKVGDMRGMRRFIPSRSLVAEAKPAEEELREDHLLQL